MKFFKYWLVCLMLCIAVLGGGNSAAFAVSDNYSDVMTDLQKDISFNADKYPAKANDYSLEVIQVAESSDNELLIYVYMPSQRFELTTIRLGFENTFDLGARWHDYGLTLLNSNGVFYKYKVNDVTVSTADVRYYSIVALHRKFVDGIDKETGNDNTVDEVFVKVAEIWTAYMLNSQLTYHREVLEVIEITDFYAGYFRYSNGFKLYVDKCDAHYIAFNTDRRMDRLIEADVEYVTQTYSYSFVPIVGENEEYGEKQKQFVSLSEKDKASTEADGLFATKYTWNRIEKGDDFRANETFSEEAKKGVANKAWVLRFAETDYTLTSGVNGATFEHSTKVSKVTILRLYFETDDKFYNLGVVSNKVTGGDNPSNLQTPPPFDFWKWLSEKTGLPVWLCQLIVGLIGVSILLSILSIFLPIKEILRTACYAVWRCAYWLVTAPFRLIIWLCKKIFNRGAK